MALGPRRLACYKVSVMLDRLRAVPLPFRSGGTTGWALPGLALLIGAVPFIVHAWVALQGFYGQDDFLIVYRSSRSEPGDLAFLLQNYNGHLSPGMFLLAWLAHAISPVNYALLIWPLLIMQAAALVLLWRLLVEIFGARWVLLVPFAVYAFSPIILFSSLWWAYGVTLIPLLLSMFGALLAHVRYLRTGARRQAVYAILWIVAGLAFYEKAALFVGLMFGVTVLMAPATEQSPIREAIRRHWRVWLAHVGLIMLYAVAYTGLTGGSARTTTAYSLIPGLARRMILDTLLVPMAGVPVRSWIDGAADILPPSDAVLLLVGVAAIGVLFAGVVVGGRRGCYAWLLLAGYLLMDVALVAVARLSLLGVLVGTDCRYIADAVPVVALCATFAFLPARGAEPPPRRARTPVPTRRRIPLRVAAVALTLLMMVGTTISFVRMAPSFRFATARAYVQTATVELARTPGLPLYDGPVPEQLMISWFGSEARTSRVVSMLPDRPRFDRPGETIYQLDRTGTPRPIERMVNIVEAQPGPAGDCGYAVTQDASIVYLREGVLGKRVIRLVYYTSTAGDGWVSVPGSSIKVTFEQGVHVLYVPIEGLFGALAIRRATPGAPVCVASLQVGEPVV